MADLQLLLWLQPMLLRQPPNRTERLDPGGKARPGNKKAHRLVGFFVCKRGSLAVLVGGAGFEPATPAV